MGRDSVEPLTVNAISTWEFGIIRTVTEGPSLRLSAAFRNSGDVSVRPEPVEGLAMRSWFDKLTTNGQCRGNYEIQY